jgi:choline-glycine betaine transporter
VAVVLFVLLLLLAEPPVVHGLANRIEPWILGVPFLYFYLFVVYVALVGVLLWALRKGL